MPATVTAADLVALANRAGFAIAETTDRNSARIYIWSASDGAVLYVGKADGLVPNKRHRDEEAWVSKDPHAQDFLMGGFVYLIRRNNGAVSYYNVTMVDDEYAAFDSTRVAEMFARNGWDAHSPLGTSIATAAKAGWSIHQLESLLIRLCVRLGVPIGNAHGTSMWEHASPMDALAGLLSDDIAACHQGVGSTDIRPRSER